MGEAADVSAETLHSSVALAHWYIGQAALKIKNGHYDQALVAMKNADRFVSIVGRKVAPDLEERRAV